MKHNAIKVITEIKESADAAHHLRSVRVIREAERNFRDIVWYNRHQSLKQEVENGERRIVDVATGDEGEVIREIWNVALRDEARVERRYRPDELEIADLVELGMLLGKLSALRWVLGEKWDSLDI